MDINDNEDQIRATGQHDPNESQHVIEGGTGKSEDEIGSQVGDMDLDIGSESQSITGLSRVLAGTGIQPAQAIVDWGEVDKAEEDDDDEEQDHCVGMAIVTARGMDGPDDDWCDIEDGDLGGYTSTAGLDNEEESRGYSTHLLMPVSMGAGELIAGRACRCSPISRS